MRPRAHLDARNDSQRTGPRVRSVYGPCTLPCTVQSTEPPTINCAEIYYFLADAEKYSSFNSGYRVKPFFIHTINTIYCQDYTIIRYIYLQS